MTHTLFILRLSVNSHVSGVRCPPITLSWRLEVFQCRLTDLFVLGRARARPPHSRRFRGRHRRKPRVRNGPNPVPVGHRIVQIPDVPPSGTFICCVQPRNALPRRECRAAAPVMRGRSDRGANRGYERRRGGLRARHFTYASLANSRLAVAIESRPCSTKSLFQRLLCARRGRRPEPAPRGVTTDRVRFVDENEC